MLEVLGLAPSSSCSAHVRAAHNSRSWQLRKAAWMEQRILLHMTFHTHGQQRTSPLDDIGITVPAQRTTHTHSTHVGTFVTAAQCWTCLMNFPQGQQGRATPRQHHDGSVRSTPLIGDLIGSWFDLRQLRWERCGRRRRNDSREMSNPGLPRVSSGTNRSSCPSDSIGDSSFPSRNPSSLILEAGVQQLVEGDNICLICCDDPPAAVLLRVLSCRWFGWSCASQLVEYDRRGVSRHITKVSGPIPRPCRNTLSDWKGT